MTATASVPQSGNEADSLPILSYRLLADPATRQQFITQLRRTLRTVGFFYLVDFEDAVRTELYNDVARHVQDFWRLPHETRLLIDQANSPHFRGYSSFNTETTFGKKDHRDQIDLATELPRHPRAAENPRNTQPPYLNLQGPNQWLPEDVLPGFKSAILEYHTSLLALSLELVRAIAETLLPANSPLIESSVMDVFQPNAHARMKIARYASIYAGEVDGIRVKTREEEDDGFGVGAHRDGGGLTVLMQDDVGGLQVQRWDGTWIDAPPLPCPSFVCNIGQQISHLSRELYPSTTHRVLANRSPSGCARFSVPFFLCPSLEKIVRPLPVEALDLGVDLSDDDGVGEKEVVSEIKKGDLIVGDDEVYGWSTWRGVTRSHRKVVRNWYPALLVNGE